jgi:hypothetical protein
MSSSDHDFSGNIFAIVWKISAGGELRSILLSSFLSAFVALLSEDVDSIGEICSLFSVPAKQIHSTLSIFWSFAF